MITYLIIASATTVVVLKAWKQFAPKKKKAKQNISKSVLSGHNCNECSAECQLRDLPKYVIEKNLDECVQVEKKSKQFQP